VHRDIWIGAYSTRRVIDFGRREWRKGSGKFKGPSREEINARRVTHTQGVQQVRVGHNIRVHVRAGAASRGRIINGKEAFTLYRGPGQK